MSSSSTYIFLDTRDAVEPTSPSVASWVLNLAFNEYAQTYLQLETACFANAVYPFTTNNNTLIYEEKSASSTTTTTITAQNYTGTQLASFLATQMTADSQESTTYTASYDTQTKKLTISGTNNFRILSTSTCLDELGVNASGMTSADTTYTSDYPVRLDGTHYVDIISNLSTRNINSSQRTNVLGRVYLTSAFGELQTYQSATNDKMRIFSNELNSINLRLVDDKGNLWDLPSNSKATYTFRLTVA